MSYLDPKNDLTFKRIFGEHIPLLKSFLNSLLPLEIPIESLEYLPAELAPRSPLSKTSIVDVHCTDELKRQFIVEMQMIWTDDFMKRILFNASKAYSVQIDRGEHYYKLQSVYSLAIVNHNFKPNTDEFCHLYKISNSRDPKDIIEGLEFVFYELPKVKATSQTEKKLGVLWLRFLNEIKNKQEEIPKEFLSVPEIKKAAELLKESSFTKAQLAAYDKYWDNIRTEELLYEGARKEGINIGITIGEEIGLQKGEEIGLQKGREEAEEIGEQKLREKEKLIVQNLIQKGFSTKVISEIIGLTEEEIESVIRG